MPRLAAGDECSTVHPMADPRSHSEAHGTTLLLGVVVGAIAGASGLAWWLLKETERRRQLSRASERKITRDLALNGDNKVPFAAHTSQANANAADLESPFQDRVQQLNQAIDEVRRQLEQLQPRGGGPAS